MITSGMMLGGRPVYDITIASNGGVWQRSVDATQVPTAVPVLLILRVNSAIERQSTLTSLGAIHIDSLANGSEVQVINSGYLLGKGGAGGAGGSAAGFTPAASAGGPAIRADFTGLLRITNSAGHIWGGGGGGGGGGECGIWFAPDNVYEPDFGGSGGGGGAGGGAGGAAGTELNGNGVAGTAGTTGSVGTNGTGGDKTTHSQSGDGASGGAYGTAGSTGSSGTKHGGGPSDGASYAPGGTGGAAGYAILHNAGTTVSFVNGSGSPNVKGTVGV